MSCRDLETRLDDYVDGHLSENENRCIEEHLAHCSTCRDQVERLRSLLDLVAALPESLDPRGDLWPGIAARIRQSQAHHAHQSRDQERVRPEGAATGSDGLSLPRRMRSARWWAGAATAVAVTALVLSIAYLSLNSANTPWQVARLQGLPRIDSEYLQESGRLPAGKWLETDDSSRAMLSAASVGHVEVEPKTRIRLLRASDQEQRLQLERGKMHAMIWAPPRLFLVETRAAVAVDLGCAYTLEVDDHGNGLLHVTAGWVAMEWQDREAIVPAGALCETRPGRGPGTPYYEDASEVLRARVRRLDFEDGSAEDLAAVLSASRPRDAVTLWHLLQRVGESDRGRVYDRLASLVSAPAGSDRDDVLRLDPRALDLWRTRLHLPAF